MARVRRDQPLVPSVLDRLLNDNPESNYEPAASRHQVLRELKVSVRRDLENLLNTRIRCLSVPDDCKELSKNSLVNYGIPDITGETLDSVQDCEAFCKNLEKIIRRYEPRFQKVTVTPTQATNAEDRTFHFRIDALLIAEPAPEPIIFDSELRPETGGFEVKEADA
jgi:type VI secretion system protein ImpF